MNPNVIILNNLMLMQRDHTSYEEALYNQLLVTVKTKARLDEIICRNAIKDAKQHGERNHQTPGGVTPSCFESEEYRDDDPPTTV